MRLFFFSVSNRHLRHPERSPCGRHFERARNFLARVRSGLIPRRISPMEELPLAPLRGNDKSEVAKILPLA